MKTLSFTTLAAGFPYDALAPQYENPAEALDDMGDEKALRQLNQKLKQDSTQGPKQPVRDVVLKVAEEMGFLAVIEGLPSNQSRLDDEYVAILEADSRVSEAVEHAREIGEAFRLWEGRGPSGGKTLKEGVDLLREAKKAVSAEKYAEILASLVEEVEG